MKQALFFLERGDEQLLGLGEKTVKNFWINY